MGSGEEVTDFSHDMSKAPRQERRYRLRRFKAIGGADRILGNRKEVRKEKWPRI